MEAIDDDKMSPLDIAAVTIIDEHGKERIKARKVAETLKANNFETKAADFGTFMTIVGNTLRILAKKGKVGSEKTGKFVHYYSLKNDGSKI